MTQEKLRDMLAAVFDAVRARDFEKAASKEHDLYVAIFTSIAEDPTGADRLAAAALIIADSEFPRWG